DTQRLFKESNNQLEQSGKPQLFNLKLVAAEHEVVLNDGSFVVRRDIGIQDDFKADLVIIPAMSGDMITATFLNKGYAAWIENQYNNGAEIASLCTGSFLLAFSGLLKGKECTTHWAYADEFGSFYPAMKLMEERVFTSQGGLYSSGGNVSYW